MSSAARRRAIAPIGLAAVLACLVSALAVLGLAPGADASRAAGDPNYERPVVGTCLDYSIKDLSKPTDSSTPVSCTAKHTALVVAVVTPPAKVKLDPRPKHQGAIYKKIARECYAAVDTTLGGSAKLRAKTAYTFGYFVPTKAQLAQGARWVRCDLVLQGGKRLAPLPTPLLGSLSDANQRCILISGRQVLTTACSRAHGFRSSKTVKLGGKKYPSIKSLQSAARAHCAKAAGVGWFASWPTSSDWTYGHERELVCYVQSTS